MKLSILITTYNYEDCINNTLISVLNQHLPESWEILIGDDGSSDRTVSIINEWIKKYPKNIRLFVRDRDDCTQLTGMRAALNRAALLREAQGEYINFLDGDDCFLGKDKFIHQIDLLESPENADCICSAHNIEAFVTAENRTYNMVEDIATRKLSFSEYWGKYYFHTNTILFRRQVIEKLLDPLYMYYLNDNFITFLVLQFGKVYYCNETWARYNITGTGLWTNHKKVYGTFRNVQLFDLELNELPNQRHLIVLKHQSDLLKIKRVYDESCYEEIKTLISGLDPKVFKYTLLLSKYSNLSTEEQKEKKRLFFEAKIGYYRFKLWRAFRKILRTINNA